MSNLINKNLKNYIIWIENNDSEKVEIWHLNGTISKIKLESGYRKQRLESKRKLKLLSNLID